MTATHAPALEVVPETPQRLGERLIAASLITEGQLLRALAMQTQTGRPIGRVLVDLGVIDDDRLTPVLSAHLDLPAVDLRREPVDPEAAQLVPEDFDALVSYVELFKKQFERRRPKKGQIVLGVGEDQPQDGDDA